MNISSPVAACLRILALIGYRAFEINPVHAYKAKGIGVELFCQQACTQPDPSEISDASPVTTEPQEAICLRPLRNIARPQLLGSVVHRTKYDGWDTVTNHCTGRPRSFVMAALAGWLHTSERLRNFAALRAQTGKGWSHQEHALAAQHVLR